jgi:hypothetical protein
VQTVSLSAGTSRYVRVGFHKVLLRKLLHVQATFFFDIHLNLQEDNFSNDEILNLDSEITVSIPRAKGKMLIIGGEFVCPLCPFPLSWSRFISPLFLRVVMGERKISFWIVIGNFVVFQVIATQGK